MAEENENVENENVENETTDIENIKIPDIEESTFDYKSIFGRDKMLGTAAGIKTPKIPSTAAVDEYLKGIETPEGKDVYSKLAAMYRSKGEGRLIRTQKNLSSLLAPTLDLLKERESAAHTRFAVLKESLPEFDDSDIFGDQSGNAMPIVDEIKTISSEVREDMRKLSRLNPADERYDELRKKIQKSHETLVDFDAINKKLLTIRNTDSDPSQWSTTMSEEEVAMWTDIYSSNGANIKIIDGKLHWIDPENPEETVPIDLSKIEDGPTEKNNAATNLDIQIRGIIGQYIQQGGTLEDPQYNIKIKPLFHQLGAVGADGIKSLIFDGIKADDIYSGIQTDQFFESLMINITNAEDDESKVLAQKYNNFQSIEDELKFINDLKRNGVAMEYVDKEGNKKTLQSLFLNWYKNEIDKMIESGDVSQLIENIEKEEEEKESERQTDDDDDIDWGDEESIIITRAEDDMLSEGVETTVASAEPEPQYDELGNFIGNPLDDPNLLAAAGDLPPGDYGQGGELNTALQNMTTEQKMEMLQYLQENDPEQYKQASELLDMEVPEEETGPLFHWIQKNDEGKVTNTAGLKNGKFWFSTNKLDNIIGGIGPSVWNRVMQRPYKGKTYDNWRVGVSKHDYAMDSKGNIMYTKDGKKWLESDINKDNKAYNKIVRYLDKNGMINVNVQKKLYRPTDVDGVEKTIKLNNLTSGNPDAWIGSQPSIEHPNTHNVKQNLDRTRTFEERYNSQWFGFESAEDPWNYNVPGEQNLMGTDEYRDDYGLYNPSRFAAVRMGDGFVLPAIDNVELSGVDGINDYAGSQLEFINGVMVVKYDPDNMKTFEATSSSEEMVKILSSFYANDIKDELNKIDASYAKKMDNAKSSVQYNKIQEQYVEAKETVLQKYEDKFIEFINNNIAKSKRVYKRFWDVVNEDIIHDYKWGGTDNPDFEKSYKKLMSNNTDIGGYKGKSGKWLFEWTSEDVVLEVLNTEFGPYGFEFKYDAPTGEWSGEDMIRVHHPNLSEKMGSYGNVWFHFNIGVENPMDALAYIFTSKTKFTGPRGMTNGQQEKAFAALLWSIMAGNPVLIEQSQKLTSGRETWISGSSSYHTNEYYRGAYSKAKGNKKSLQKKLKEDYPEFLGTAEQLYDIYINDINFIKDPDNYIKEYNKKKQNK